jgi:methyltransferase (TIGR00027 family)
MVEGSPSRTARAVAAYRLGFDRPAFEGGNGEAEDRLARDVVGAEEFVPGEGMARYLRGRTAFFDRVVLRAMERGVRQVLIVGAGYDGRSLRFAKPGVRWFELDHPATQADKLARLLRLEIETPESTFVALDLADGGVDSALVSAGWEPDASSLMLCEGVAVYLLPEVVGRLLGELRSLVTVGTQLAVSLSPRFPEPERRARFREAIALAGEPARSDLTPEDATELFTAARWRRAAIVERAGRAGFVVALPVWAPARAGVPDTRSAVGRYCERVFHRRGLDSLSGHLAEAYGITADGLDEIDVGVFKVRHAGGPDWIARVFPAERPAEVTRAEAELLKALRAVGFPAEPPAAPEPVTMLDGQAVMVTELVPGRLIEVTSATARAMGELLAALHELELETPAAQRPGGGWHHLVLAGGPSDELAAIRRLVADSASRVPLGEEVQYAELVAALDRADDARGLPEALLHPDFVPYNLIGSRGGGYTLIDWAGAGRGPRLWSLAFLLWALRHSRAADVNEALAAYTERIELTGEELERLGQVLLVRPLVFACWEFCTGRESLADLAGRLPGLRSRAERIAERTRHFLA